MTMVEGLDDETDLFAVAQQLPEPSDLIDSDDEAPIIRLINALLTQAVKDNASDIHIEPFENRMTVRFRIDGVLREVLQSKRAVAPIVVSRIKVMSKLDIAEKRLPQDGRISLRIAGRAVDVRVSTIPSGHGERVVLRLLDKQAGRLTLANLGMSDEDQRIMDELVHRPHGILLVTGPTGSGKTTTLYAALERINDLTRNILTVEDPIEYHIDGIGQTQVNTKVEMTFARGLRAILRQDPDVVMVGEIRDLETAEIAVQASSDRPPRAVDAAHEHGGRRRHALARHGRRAVPAVLELDRRARAAPRARARPGHARGLSRERVREPAPERRPRDSADALQGAGRRSGLQGPHRHLRARAGRQYDAHDDPRRRGRARARALRAHARSEHPRGRHPQDPRRRHDSRGGRQSHSERLMGAYQYVAVDSGGKEHRGVLEGDTPRHVRQLLRERQLLPVEVAEVEARERKTRRQFSLFRGISGLDLALLTRQLATLVKAGLPLEEALLAVSEHTEKPRLKSIVLGVRAKVLEGHSLVVGLEDFPHAFPVVYRATVAAGEQAGQLDTVLERLAEFTESRHSLRQKVLQAMIYPIVLTFIALFIVTLMLVYVVPKVVGVFETTGQELPLLTRALIALSSLHPKLVVRHHRGRRASP